MEGTIQQLFEGHHMNYIECINVDFKSTRKESFYGIVIYTITLFFLFYLYNCTKMSYSIYPIALLCLILSRQPYCHVLILWQTFSWMLKAARMFMLLLTSMLKLNVLKETTNIMQKDMVYRSVVLTLFFFCILGMVGLLTTGLFGYLATLFSPLIFRILKCADSS